MNMAKERDISIFIVGHVTKDGMIAGPKVLEHMVDCVLYFEGDSLHTYRILRAVKNRFGSTNEIGVFEMKNEGLIEILNPSVMFLEGRPEDCAGSAVVCTIEGTRPLLAEIQGLTSMTTFGTPRRMATGIDYNRVVLLLAVLEKKVGVNMSAFDAYVNVVGGIKISETAADLAVIMAIHSSIRNKIIDKNIVIVGEVGLTGEIRSVSYCEKRITEAKKLGFRKIIIPKANYKDVSNISGIDIIPVSNVAEVIGIMF